MSSALFVSSHQRSTPSSFAITARHRFGWQWHQQMWETHPTNHANCSVWARMVRRCAMVELAGGAAPGDAIVGAGGSAGAERGGGGEWRAVEREQKEGGRWRQAGRPWTRYRVVWKSREKEAGLSGVWQHRGHTSARCSTVPDPASNVTGPSPSRSALTLRTRALNSFVVGVDGAGCENSLAGGAAS